MSEKKRPVGVTIIGILYLLLGAIAFVGALVFLFLAGLGHSDLVTQLPNAPVWLVEGGSLVLTILGLIVFLFAVVNLAIALGCFKGWGWVWTWGLVFAILNIFLSMFNAFSQGFTAASLASGLIGALVPIVVLLYLSTKNVRAFFGKA